MKTFVIFLLLVLFTSICLSDSKEIRFNITPLSFPPYIIHEPLGGIMHEVLEIAANKHGFRLSVSQFPEKRVVSALNKGTLDVHASAIEWMPPSDDYIFSDPVLQVRDVLFMASNTDFEFDGVQRLFGERLGVRTGYTYQSLEPHFDKGKITRIDSSSELYLLRMLENGRIKLAVITEHVGLWIIAKNDFTVKFKQSRKAVDATNYRLVFAKRFKPFVKKFNQELQSLKSSGELDRIISKYR